MSLLLHLQVLTMLLSKVAPLSAAALEWIDATLDNFCVADAEQVSEFFCFSILLHRVTSGTLVR